MANRTIQFCGYAYGEEPVQLNAHINGQTVFSGTVATLDEDPIFPVDMTNAPVLFSVPESALFPTTFAGSYPMTVSVATGLGVNLNFINSNYMPSFVNPVEFSGSISGTTLNVSSVTSGEILSGQYIYGNGITADTIIISGNGSTWQVNNSQIAGETILKGSINVAGTADGFFLCYNGTPVNSDATLDARSSVQMNGVPTTTNHIEWPGQWTWWVTAGSTIEYFCRQRVIRHLATLKTLLKAGFFCG